MSDLLSIGASGVRAFQGALTTTSENIANAGTAGYVRRTAQMAEVSAAGVKGINGYGVTVTGTQRAADAIRSAAVRSAGADLSRTQAGSAWLDRIQTALTGADVSGRLTSFYTSATALAADPASLAQRSVMLENAQGVAAGFAATGAALTQVMADLDQTADGDAATLSNLAGALAKVNDGLGKATAGSAGAASLADQRDQLLEQMSALSDVTATFDAAGRANVRLGGDTGPTLVSGGSAGRVSYARSAQGNVTFTVTGGKDSATFQPNGGSLAGIADAAQRIVDTRGLVADTARDFAAGVNDVQAQGRDLNNDAGAAMFAVDPADTTRLTVAITDPKQIAAASVGGGTRDGSNLANLQATRASGDYEAGITGLVAGNAAAIANRKIVGEAQNAILTGAITARDSVSAVNLDDEAVQLLRFQQAYQASSRVISVAKDVFQSLMEIR
ncbi:flagellar hook-associated protein FlgK [Sphingomonas sp. RHCKR47]|uniref:flagellar hook-associated protein FlgK n=1 Tax=Sphingomonas citricola TaxID=2862498 RepID=UPI001CA54E60|nr:flagellar hook-associated protein FlgK [Sphingomonas citricola]MBW6524058.1 flagellar hook-associated protein FlgK [Sphingomonas citricola]